MDDRDLMINLMAKGFGYIYAIEELIKDNKIDYQEFIDNEDIFLEKLNLVKQSEW